MLEGEEDLGFRRCHEEISQELDEELLSDEEIMEIGKEFLTQHSYTEEPLYSCCACGLRQMGRNRDPEVSYPRFLLGGSAVCDVFNTDHEN